MKIVKIIGLIFTILFAVAGGIIVFIVLFTYSSGNSLFAVQSNSMAPTLKTGDLIIVEPIAIENVNVDDILTFHSNNDPKTTFTHRVVAINNNMISTKGDANQNKYPMDTDFSYCVGKYKNKIPYLGYIYLFISFKYGIYLIVILILIYASLELERYFKYKKDKKQLISKKGE